jgi:hypothetical protein
MYTVQFQSKSGKSFRFHKGKNIIGKGSDGALHCQPFATGNLRRLLLILKITEPGTLTIIVPSLPKDYKLK